ncbi:MAG: DnaB-like helicase N-terminal domain-containing protein, partial [Jaaginema sp. PMC 1080.18]|nr:DnaB-like helicase N-terminal domain-containing protein [Jaaginema sp. PMC 1080.18]
MVAQFRPRKQEQIPPHNVEIEESILGGILLDSEAYPRLQNLKFKLVPEAFFFEPHQIIFRAIQALAAKGKSVDMMTVISYLSDKKKLDKAGGSARIAALVSNTVTAVNIDGYAEILIDKYIRRQLFEISQDIAAHAADSFSPLEYVCNKVKSLTEPIIEPILANSNSEENEYGCIIDKVKKILLKEFHPGKQTWKMLKLSKETGVTIKSLEALFFAHMAGEQYEPLMTFEQLKKKYGRDAQKWVVQGLLPRGSLTELYAMPGDGKTLLSYDILIKAALGEPWNGFPVANKQIKVVIIQTDEAPQAMIQTLEELLQGRNVQLFVKTCWTIGQLFQLKEELDEIKPDLLLIDSLTSINQGTGKSENDMNYALMVYVIREWMGETGMAGILIHHSNKLGDSRGSTGIPGACDQVLNLRRHPEQNSNSDPRRHLEIKKSRFRCPMTYDLDFDGETKTWTMMGQVGASLNFDGDTRDQIVALLEGDRGTTYTNRELSEVLAINSDTIRRTTRELFNERLIERVPGQRTALYYIPDDGLDDGYKFKPKLKSVNIDRQNQPQDRAAPGETDPIVCDRPAADPIAPPPPRSPQTSEAIADAIAPEAISEEDSSGSDRAIAKNVLNSEENLPKNTDRAIASPETPAPSKSECDRG